jgi:hypothetical protein
MPALRPRLPPPAPLDYTYLMPVGNFLILLLLLALTFYIKHERRKRSLEARKAGTGSAAGYHQIG